MLDNFTNINEKININIEDILSLIKKFPPPDHSKIIDALYCNERTKDFLIRSATIIDQSSIYYTIRAVDLVLIDSIPDKRAYLVMKDGSIKILNLENGSTKSLDFK